MNKEDAEKARELIEEIYPSKSLGDYGLKKTLMLKAMEWKQEQMIEKATTFIKEKVSDYFWLNDDEFVEFDKEEFSNAFKKYMEEN
ncbi:MAG: hypothetical protein J6X18_00540 [Bacteroidales bacterium]|nr:hypothetical protein [Bacteroidales bacterium]